MEKITYKKIKQTQEVNAYIEQGNHVLGVLGYTGELPLAFIVYEYFS